MVNKRSTSFDLHVGNRVRARRITLGMSQERLGISVGVTFQQVQKYEKGTNRIGAGRLQDISRALEVPPSYFFEELDIRADTSAIGEVAAAAGEVNLVSTAEGMHLNKAFARIRSVKTRRSIIDLVITIGESEAIS